LRTVRSPPGPDDDKTLRFAYSLDNLHANELLYRRVDLADVVDAHLAALAKAPAIGFGRYIISAETPFEETDLAELRADTPAVVRRRFPEFDALYRDLGWTMAPSIDRVYVSRRAISDLGWSPRHGFPQALRALEAGASFRSLLAEAVGSKGYHADHFGDEPYPVE